jgi:hypothetical protein
VRLILDTHLLLWALGQPARLSAAARKQIEKADVYVSAASIWEISIKAALGKLKANPAEVLCVFRPSGPPVPAEAGHRFRTMPGRCDAVVGLS